MSNEKQKPTPRPFTKKDKKSGSKLSDISSKRGIKARLGKGASVAAKPNASASKVRKASDLEPDRRTKRAASKQQSVSDRFKGFVADHPKAIILSLAIIMTLWLMYPALQGYYTSKRNLEIYTSVAETIRTSNAEIEAKIEGLNSEEGIRAQARERGLVEPGEIAIIIQEPQKEEPSEETEVKADAVDGQSQEKSDKDEPAKPISKGVEEKEKMKKMAEDIRNRATPLQKFLDSIFAYTPPDIKVF